MADFNSELPIRSSLPGQVNYDDIIIKIGDATNPTTQQAAVDTFGSMSSMIKDAAGNIVTTVANGGVRALEVQTQSAGPVAPGAAAAFSSLIGGQYSTSLPTLTNGQQSALQCDSSGRLWVTSSNFPLVADTNWGSVGASTIRVAAEIGNAAGAADFNFGGASAQTLRVAALLGNATGAIDYNYGAIGAQSVRVASQIGNATGAADYNNGATGAQTLRTAANLAVAGANVSNTNPVPVAIVNATVGTNVNNYKTAAAVAAGATDNHDYSITSAKTFQGKKIWASASGKLKIEVQISPDGTTFSTLWVGFNSSSDPNISIDLDQLVFLESGVGAKVRVICTNKDNQPMDVYSTISGVEV